MAIVGGVDQPAAGGGAATKEFFVTPQLIQLSQSKDDWVLRSMGASGQTFYPFQIPNDFTSLTDAVLVIIPDATETVGWVVDASVAGLNEAYNVDTRQAITQTKAVIIDLMDELDLSVVLTGLAANDYVSVRFQPNTSNIDAVGLRIKYS